MPHLKSIEIENFRVFSNKTKFDFSPITLLTGPNNSGKSSLTKAILLINNSIQNNQIEELNFNHESCLLGDFEDVRSFRRKENKQVSIKLLIELIEETDFRFELSPIINTRFLEFDLRYVDFFGRGRLERLICSFINPELVANNKRVIFDFNLRSELLKGENNEVYVTSFINIEYLFSIFKKANWLIEYPNVCNLDLTNSKYGDWQNKMDSLFQRDLIIKSLSENNNENTDEFISDFNQFLLKAISTTEGTPFNDSYRLKATSLQELLDLGFFHHLHNRYDWDRILSGVLINNELLSNEAQFSIWKDDFPIKYKTQLDKLRIDYPKLEVLINAAYEGFWIFLIDFFKEVIFKYVLNDIQIEYIKPIRLLDKNLFEKFIKKLTNFHFDQETSKFKFTTENKRFINHWLKKFGVADSLTITKITKSEYVIKLRRNKMMLELSQIGHGVSQLIPIILNVVIKTDQWSVLKHTNPFAVYYDERKLIIIEEPETNLHPKLQSLLADFFVDAYHKYAVRFIIETHSEYLIRKFQYLVAKKKILNTDLNIYYFQEINQKNSIKAENQVKKIDFLKDGSLSDDFGPGFFDEADNLAIDLFNLKKHQKN